MVGDAAEIAILDQVLQLLLCTLDITLVFHLHKGAILTKNRVIVSPRHPQYRCNPFAAAIRASKRCAWYTLLSTEAGHLPFLPYSPLDLAGGSTPGYEAHATLPAPQCRPYRSKHSDT